MRFSNKVGLQKEDSLEITIYSDTIKIDLFIMYRAGAIHYSPGFILATKQKIQFIYPEIDDLCTGDLLGILFNVPCNVEDVLEVCQLYFTVAAVTIWEVFVEIAVLYYLYCVLFVGLRCQIW